MENSVFMKGKLFFLFCIISLNVSGQYFNSDAAYQRGRADRYSADAMSAIKQQEYKKAYRLFKQSLNECATANAYMGMKVLIESGEVMELDEEARQLADRCYDKALRCSDANFINSYYSQYTMALQYPGLDDTPQAGRCPHCHGTGVCPECRGTGEKTSAVSGIRQCTYCKGTRVCYLCKRLKGR